MNKNAILITLLLACMPALGSNAQATPHVSLGSLYGGNTLIINVGDCNFLMQRVEGGTFTMGATPEQRSTNPVEHPAHQVNISTFYMAETELTQDVWIAVMQSNPSLFSSNMKHPVNNITWSDSQLFVSALNALLRANSDYCGISFALPTEAEWEFAARGGLMSKGYRFAGSNSEGDVAWNEFNSEANIHPVKQKHPNELGIYDMNGNVWEWCIDLWNPSFYNSSTPTNPVCLTTLPQYATYHVARGNSFNSSPGGYIAWRNAFPITSKSSHIGMRLALHIDANNKFIPIE